MAENRRSIRERRDFEAESLSGKGCEIHQEWVSQPSLFML